MDPKLPASEPGPGEEVGTGSSDSNGRVRVPAELGQHPVPAVEQPQPGHRAGAREDVVGDTRRLEHPEDLVVQVHRARQRIGLVVLLQDQHLEAAPGEQQRRREPDGPSADHDHGGAGHRASVARVAAGCTTAPGP